MVAILFQPQYVNGYKHICFMCQMHTVTIHVSYIVTDEESINPQGFPAFFAILFVLEDGVYFEWLF